MRICKEIITSRNNPTVKWVASLSEKKGRATAQSFIAEGEKLVFEAIEAGLPVTHVFVSEGKWDDVSRRFEILADRKNLENTEICILSEGAFDKISTEKAPQGVISVIKYLDFFRNMDIIYKEEFFLNAQERTLFLHSVRDPGNLGAVIRSAVAFGTEHIVMSSDSVDVYNPKVIRSAMGSLFKVKITIVSDVASFISSAQACGRRVLAAELTDSARSLSDISLACSDIVMIGNEGHGIPEEISKICDMSVYIPISGKTESLNASVAAAIFMWEQAK